MKKKKSKKSRKVWKVLFAVVITLCIVDWAIPDPVLFVDEILLTFGTVYTGIKSFKA